MRKNNLTETLQDFLKSRLDNIHTVIPGTFESYEGSASRKASVKPMVKYRTPANEDIEMPIIENVPVVFPSSGNFNLLFPIQKGDGCLILFSETGIGNYLAGTGQIANADDQSKFSLTDAIAIPGLWTFSNSPQAVNSIELTDTGSLVITVNNKTMEFNSLGQINMLSGVESFVKGDTLFTIWNTYLTALSVGIVPGDAVANAASLTAIKSAAAALQAQLSTIKSLTIKGE